MGSDEHSTQGLPVRTNSAPMPGMVMDDGPPFDDDEDDATHDELDEDDGRLTPARTEEVIFFFG